MNREHFIKVVEETLDSLPEEFRSRMRNVAVLVEDVPPNQPLPESGPAKATASGCLPWRSHHQEERIQSAVWARSYRALSKEY